MLFTWLFRRYVKVYKLVNGEIKFEKVLPEDIFSYVQCRKHRDFPKYCLNRWGMKRKLYVEDITHFLYYKENGSKVYIIK